MKDVNVTELRQNLPAYLARVQRGERVRVTSRRKIIAEISAPSADANRRCGGREAAARGVLRFEDPLAPAIDPAEWDANR